MNKNTKDFCRTIFDKVGFELAFYAKTLDNILIYSETLI